MTTPERQVVQTKEEATEGYTTQITWQDPILKSCLAIDLEVSKDSLHIHEFAAVRGTDLTAMTAKGGQVSKTLEQLDGFGSECKFLLGHNVIDFDHFHLQSANSGLRILSYPCIDTLYLNPLAFPRNPYHHLVKHYQNGQLLKRKLNDPELDSRLCAELLVDQLKQLRSLQSSDPNLVTAWHWLTTRQNTAEGFSAVFKAIRNAEEPGDEEAIQLITDRLSTSGCRTYAATLASSSRFQALGWPLAYTLAWLTVADGNSVIPPWVSHRHPETLEIVQALRDTACNKPECAWCKDRHDAVSELKRWFRFDSFRLEPVDSNGKPLQQVIVESALAGNNTLGILPTGTGKSICYQIPALSRFEKTGGLSIVISPLVALMEDQIHGLKKIGIECCAAINGLLSLPERRDILDRVRLGDIGLLIIAPEQLRNHAVRSVLAQRQIAAWIFDEAHCLSKWGHDFRPDYRYVARFIHERAGGKTPPPVLCLTATAKPDVIIDIVEHFKTKVSIDLAVFDGGAKRTNLGFEVVPCSSEGKLTQISQLLNSHLSSRSTDGGIIYCSTRKRTEEVAGFLKQRGMKAAYFHANLQPETKKQVQEAFISGELRVIAATNAFGMGIDKPDVRIVIHADIPGSLENYLQEAGRAGRDRLSARCVLLFSIEDVERQFNMSARSRLKQDEIQSILDNLRRMDRRKRLHGEIVATSGEILAEQPSPAFERDSATDDTRVRTGLSWLEESALLKREENHVTVFPSSLKVYTLAEAKQKLEARRMDNFYRDQLLGIVKALIEAEKDDGISTDLLMSAVGLTPEGLRNALRDLEQLGIASNDTAITAYVHRGVPNSSEKRFETRCGQEERLINLMRELASDMSVNDTSALNLRHVTQDLKNNGYPHTLPDDIYQLLLGIRNDGRGEGTASGSARLQRDGEIVRFTLLRNWSALDKVARLRRSAAGLLLRHFLTPECLPLGQNGLDLLSSTTLGQLQTALSSDLVLMAEIQNPGKLLDYAVLWLHEQSIIKLNKGMAIFRPAMTIHLTQDTRRFDKTDYKPLQFHYDSQTFQIHVMSEYAERGLQHMADALQLSIEYFSLPQDEFIKRWMSGDPKALERQTTRESWRLIVESLNNSLQQRIVADERERTNVLLLAGPGSGKTRVLVHRIAYLLRVRRENPRGILALCYNRHAAAEIRRRLKELVGDDVNGVTIMTCHALAMRLAGVSFAKRADQLNTFSFEQVLQDATRLLRGEGLEPDDADEQRSRLLTGFRWILVDEYQDITHAQYELIAALAGRTQQDPDKKLTLFAVGDDDQNIYSFNGTDVSHIRRLADEYQARTEYMVENYRSTGAIITAANTVISSAKHRLKLEHPIKVNRSRRTDAPGGIFSALDKIAHGQVHVLQCSHVAGHQAVAAMQELQRLATLDPLWDWCKCAVIGRNWKDLNPIRAFCELHGISVHMANEEGWSVWRLRETQRTIRRLKANDDGLFRANDLLQWLEGQKATRWWDILREATESYAFECGNEALPVQHYLEWLAEWGREVRRQPAGLTLTTAHGAKGLEFDHVVVLDGEWQNRSGREDADAPCRLYYVAMTRAKKTLTLCRFKNKPHSYIDNLTSLVGVASSAPDTDDALAMQLDRTYKTLSLREIDLGFAGRFNELSPLHRQISETVCGDILYLSPTTNDRWSLVNENGTVVGKTSQTFKVPKNHRCIEARAVAVLRHRAADSAPEYQHLYKCAEWEVIVPELLLEVMHTNAATD